MSASDPNELIEQDDHNLSLEITALSRLLNFLAELPGNFIPRQFEAFQHLPILGDGSLYSVRQHVRGAAMGKTQVLKVFKKSISPETPDPVEQTEFRSLLLETKILALQYLNEHENIITLEDIVWGVRCLEPVLICPTLVLEQATFPNLDAFQSSAKEVDWAARKCLCYDVAAGLEALHLAGIVHGDLNSSHILIFDHPKRRHLAKITGFGRSIIPSISKQTQIPHGTVPWNAPEVEDGKVRQDQLFQTDIFPLGLMLWKIFVHQDLYKTFDLPLDEALRNEDFKQILAMPYLFRFIPLLIEHEVGLIEENDFKMLTDLFSCTVRIAPRQRSLQQTLELLRPHNGRESEA